MLWSNPTSIDALDAIMCLSALLCATVAYRRGHLRFYCLLFVFGALIELASIHFAHTHCHRSSAWLNVCSCSSANSIAFYGPWLYLPLLLAMDGHWAAPSAVALLQIAWGAAYEVLGAQYTWWTWSGDAEFASRVHGVPLITLLFHPVLGFSVAWALRLTKQTLSVSVAKGAFVLAMAVPIALAFSSLLHAADRALIDRSHSVACIFAVFFVLPVLLDGLRSKRASLAEDRPLILVATAAWHAFFVSRAWLGLGSFISPNIMALVASTSLCSFLATYAVLARS